MTGRDVEVSIVVACRNEIGHIRDLLDSIVQQEMGDTLWEAIVADGMSSDGTRAVLDEYCVRHPQIRVVDNPRRIVSTGLNHAIRAARGPIIMRMDAHTSYAPDYCRCCLETLERTGADNVGGPARTKASDVRARAVAAAYHSRFSTGGARFHDVSYQGWVDTVPYGCWRKATLERFGLFDETLVRNQDDELNLRLVRMGARIWQDPAIVAWYSPRARLSPLFRQYFQYGFWKVAVIRKHRLPGSWRHIVPVLFVLLHALVIVSLVTALALAAPTWATASAIAGLVLVGTYGAATLSASVLTAQRSGWTTLPYLPAAFAAYHFAYGLGFLFGLRWLVRPPDVPGKESIYTSLSR